MHTITTVQQIDALQLLLTTFKDLHTEGTEHAKQVICKAFVDSGENLDQFKDWDEDRIVVLEAGLNFPRHRGPYISIYFEYDDTNEVRARSYFYLKVHEGVLHGEY